MRMLGLNRACIIKIMQKYDHFKKDHSNEECEKTCNENNAQNTVESASKQVMGRAVVPKVVAKLVLT